MYPSRFLTAVLLLSLTLTTSLPLARGSAASQTPTVCVVNGPPPVLVAWSAAPAPAEPPSPPPEAGASAAVRQRAAQALLDLPLRFVPGAGNDPAARFSVQGTGHTIWLTENEVVFAALERPPTADHRLSTQHGAKYLIPDTQSPTPNITVRLRFPGANPHPTIEGLSPLGGVVNYFLGNDPARWRANVPAYGAVVYRELYPGVDLVYRGTAGHLKSEFRVVPGADPGAIQMAYAGVEAMCLRDGALVLETALGELVEEPPLVYQEVDGVRRAVPGGYVLLGEDRVGFQVGEYDPARPLVIDPELTYSSYLGGSGSDDGHGIVVDGVGNIYVVGGTPSSDFPTTDNVIQPAYGGGNSDVFITQIVNAGNVYTYGYSTFLGGSATDIGRGIDVDGVGNVYVTGWTQSSNFPTTGNAIQPAYGGGAGAAPGGDAFVAQIVNVGGVYTLGYSTYLGGTNDEASYDIVVDDAGNAHVTGFTTSTDFPTHNAVQSSYGTSRDAFVTQIISANGVYTYGCSTYLGGNGYDEGQSIALDDHGGIYVTGDAAAGFPTTVNVPQPDHGGGGSDAFVTQIISASGVYTLGYSTYLGGGSDEAGYGIAVDGDGNAHVTGWTLSSNFPTHNAIQEIRKGSSDVFVTQIVSASGVYTLGYSTYMGGAVTEVGWDIAVSAHDTGSTYVVGSTKSPDFPMRNAIQPVFVGNNKDAFVAQIVNVGDVYTYGHTTYLGGNGGDLADAVAVDDAGNIYVTGGTGASDFPTRNATQSNQGGQDAFVTKISPTGLLLDKTVSSTIAEPGQSITYTLTYYNDSMIMAAGVIITDMIPITLTNVSIARSGARITPTGSISSTWLVEDLIPGTGGVIVITGVISPSIEHAFTLTNRATITSTDAGYVDPKPANNTSVVHTTVDKEPPTPPTLVSPPNDTFITAPTLLPLVWQPSPSSDVAGYLVDWSGIVVDVGNVTQYPIPLTVDGTYTWTVAAYDVLSNTSVYTSVWSFTLDTQSPEIVTVAPNNGEMEVAITAPVVVTFSEAINTSTLAYIITPDPSGWAVSWDAGSMVATLTHATFAYWTTHTVTVTAAADRAGNPLADAPYTWHWTTVPYRLYLPLALK